jgi:hypothetical protein
MSRNRHSFVQKPQYPPLFLIYNDDTPAVHLQHNKDYSLVLVCNDDAPAAHLQYARYKDY